MKCTCPCGFHGGPRNIRQHRLNCPSWIMQTPNPTAETILADIVSNDYSCEGDAKMMRAIRAAKALLAIK